MVHQVTPVDSTRDVRRLANRLVPTAVRVCAVTRTPLVGVFSIGPGRFIAPDLSKTLPQVQDGYAMIPFNDPGIRLELDENKLRPWVVRAPMVADARQPRHMKLRVLLDHA